jgi:hypothetical protein
MSTDDRSYLWLGVPTALALAVLFGAPSGRSKGID